jgi:hypothetical protein
MRAFVFNANNVSIELHLLYQIKQVVQLLSICSSVFRRAILILFHPHQIIKCNFLPILCI